MVNKYAIVIGIGEEEDIPHGKIGIEGKAFPHPIPSFEGYHHRFRKPAATSNKEKAA